MTRTIDDVSYSYNRRPENRRIYAEQQIDWAYLALLKFQRERHTSIDTMWMLFWDDRIEQAARDLAEAHERHLNACAALGPAKISTRRCCLDGYEYTLRDAAGFIRARDNGFDKRSAAAITGHQAAINLGLEVE